MAYDNNNGDTPILTMLYSAYQAEHQNEIEGIRAAFESLYESMNGMTLQEVDRVIYPVCRLCATHEEHGFIEGIKVGVRLVRELEESG